MTAGVHTYMRDALRPMLGRAVMPVIAALALCAAPGSVAAQQAERSGKEVVDAVCATCHATGAHGAPKIGDKKAWEQLASQGLGGLTKNVLTGIRQMPPHGGNFLLTDTEIQRAITYMVNESGGHWTEPISTTAPPAQRTGEEIVKAQCSKCHKDGVGGAPKIGDLDAWIPRLKPGLDVVVRSAINGHGGMPARGGMANLTDAELRSAIVYMFSQGHTATKTP
jgi:cytochrome c5